MFGIETITLDVVDQHLALKLLNHRNSHLTFSKVGSMPKRHRSSFFTMHFSSLLFLFAFSNTSIFASPVGNSNLDQHDATLLDIFKESTNQPPSDIDDSQSTSQIFGTPSNSEISVFNTIDGSVGTPQQPDGDNSANLKLFWKLPDIKLPGP